ncbi:dihydropyrimidinase [Selenihalanaerobacter shriftii]|uniref:Dihydropyrimidinase n=1 Tax=Selenihalanaerobacter shriftii TaxID=142842 RepID=A0A1T4PIV6_9FIRM|nr:dihydropyrimidinase [Selenihalanaerobacter shriftii]SJZ91515.1 dihydropyrimidinase [Selenihalanaerobacter shriftii]
MLLKGGKLVSENGVKKADIRISGEIIGEVANNLTPDLGEEVIDVAGKLVLPGIIDAHTHFKLRSRGTVTADDFYWGGRSAAFGGVTTVVDYADQAPDSLLKGVKNRIKDATDSVIDYTFHLVINDDFQPQIEVDKLHELREFGINSIKLFTTYQDMYMLDDKKWSPLLKAAKEAKLLVTVHAEKDKIIQKKQRIYDDQNKLGVKYHSDIRPDIAESETIRDLCKYVEDIQMPIYIAHLSSKKGYEEILKGRKAGINIRAETTPHYLLLTRDLLAGQDGRLNFMTPPLREEKDNEALWEGVIDETIDVIATDHCAFSIKQKEEGSNSLDVLPGIPGVETLLPLVYTYGVKEGRITLSKMVKLLSTMPAKIFGLYPRKGSLRPGSDADLVVFDPNKKMTIEHKQLHSKAGYTPYQGMKMEGSPLFTILRGNKLVKDGEFLGTKGSGQFIKANLSSLYSENLD